MPKAIVIGAGIAGIASAIRLAIKGFDVHVFEANSYPGGKLSEIKCKDYRFDAGPSLFTMPHYVDELFLLAGKNPQDYFKYEKLDLICRYFYEDGTVINAWADQEKFVEELSAKTTDSKHAIRRFINRSAQIYHIVNPVFLEKSLHRFSTYCNLKTLKSLLQFPAIDPLRTMNSANESIFRDSKTLRFFNRYATYNGSNPYQAPATLNVIPHLEQQFGAYFPVGGMNQITASLVRLAEELGVKFSYNSPVEEIITGSRKVEGAKVNGEIVKAEKVVSNMDVWFTYNKLLKKYPVPNRIDKQERSSSALIFYWGIKKQFKNLDLHNIFFSENYEEEFNATWRDNRISYDPTVYLNISSKYKTDDAPANCENWFVMINVPANKGQDWDKLISEAKVNILEKLSRNLKENIAGLIECEQILDPRTIESRTYSYQGSIYGTSSNNKFSAFFRHPNFLPKIKGLYFVGGSVHPGGGIPLALLSAKIVDELV
ncbi:1-hydroxycarotenoid 3,4-desaturase CrtD [Rubrolithibacter danxiaensis]|uniref:1-hydroxycarotenoid 3,4-desaturase CrtD n=1 Tax=Rubrolithibacter danxiaensis TaxID=3390805 RepID=UPI003BF80C36